MYLGAKIELLEVQKYPPYFPYGSHWYHLPAGGAQYLMGDVCRGNFLWILWIQWIKFLIFDCFPLRFSYYLLSMSIWMGTGFLSMTVPCTAHRKTQRLRSPPTRRSWLYVLT